MPATARQILDGQDITRAVTRIAHEILERHRGASHLVLVGIHTRGVYLAQRLAAQIERFEGVRPPTGELDISLHRDDAGAHATRSARPTHIPVNITNRQVVLVDDVLYTGRTGRAALDALLEHGRPSCIQLAVLIDRGHRELPIRPDYVGKNIPTARDERVLVRLAEIDGTDTVGVLRLESPEAPHERA